MQEVITHLTAMSYNSKAPELRIREAISASCWLVRKRVSKTGKTNHMIIAIYALVFTALGEDHLQHLTFDAQSRPTTCASEAVSRRERLRRPWSRTDTFEIHTLFYLYVERVSSRSECAIFRRFPLRIEAASLIGGSSLRSAETLRAWES